ncbi:Cytochrome P450 4e3 (CYPIVE3) [Durusdinium trenchii]|uniref:Cytochrome P450 4e3 (CYPIVE3) n=1 Tax=Durusdinium trenchii TaxID=1381693 RepID=A0ABP0RMH9_9DINO
MSTRRLALRVLAVAVAFKVVRFLIEVRRRHRLLLKLPHLPGSVREGWLTGVATGPDFLKGKPVTLDNIRDTFIGGLRQVLDENDETRRKGLLCTWLANSSVAKNVPNTGAIVIAHGMDVCRELLSKRLAPKLEKGTSYLISEPLIGRSVLRVSGDEWHPQRVILDKGFKDIQIADAVPNVTTTVQRLVDKWTGLAATGQTINLPEEALKLTMDVLGRFAFSYEFGSITAPSTADAPLYEAFNVLLTTLNVRSIMPVLHDLRHIPVGANLDFTHAMAKLDHHVGKIVGDRRKEFERNPNREVRDLLDMMFSSTIEGSKRKLTEQQIIDNIKVMLFAGHDTTGAALTWAVLLLACPERFPDMPVTDVSPLQKFRQEYESIIGTDPTVNPTYEQLQRMPYLDSILTETLRLYPSAGFTRMPVEDIDVCGYKIPKGTEVAIFPYLAQRNPDVYDKPNQFIPERWLSKLVKEDLSLKAQVAIMGKKEAYLPFSLGERNCVGRNLALHELKIALIKIFQQFDIEPTAEFQVEPVLWMTLNPQTKIPIRAVPRAH